VYVEGVIVDQFAAEALCSGVIRAEIFSGLAGGEDDAERVQEGGGGVAGEPGIMERRKNKRYRRGWFVVRGWCGL
jgi:hypothetical protein